MYYLNCIKSPPQRSQDIDVPYIMETVTDACFVENSGKRILLRITKCRVPLITPRGHEYHTESLSKLDITDSRLVQSESFTDSKDIRPVGITTDGSRRVFVSDARSECIRVYDLNGKYRGIVLRKGQQGLGKPRVIRWCKDQSSLVISHHNEKLGYRISVLKYI